MQEFLPYLLPADEVLLVRVLRSCLRELNLVRDNISVFLLPAVQDGRITDELGLGPAVQFLVFETRGVVTDVQILLQEDFQ